MKKNHVRKYMRRGEIRRVWKKAVSILSCIVVFVTTYMLLLPAITMEKTAICGIEAHQHDESCWETETKLTCGLDEEDGHQHTDDCFTTTRKLICTLEQHTHSEQCFNIKKQPSCALEEHSHTDECFREDRLLSCPLEETADHQHTEDCYEREKVLICGKEAHTHTAECFGEDNETVLRVENNDNLTEEFAKEPTDMTAEDPSELLPETEDNEDFEEESSEIATEMASEGTVDSMSEAEVTDEEFLDNQTGEEVVNETSEDITNSLTDSKNGETQEDQDTGEDAIEEAEGKEDDTDPTTEVSFDEEAEQENIDSVADSSPEETEDSEALTEADSEMAESENTVAEAEIVSKESQSEGTDSAEEPTVTDSISAEPVAEESIKDETTAKESQPGVSGLLTYKGPDYTVTVSFDESAGIPEGASLIVREITQEQGNYQKYSQEAEKAVAEKTDQKVSWVRLFDISIEKDGRTVEPQAPVSVRIAYAEAIEQVQSTEVNTVHFEGEEETPKLLDTEAEGTEDTVEQVSFDAGSFSVFAIVGTTIEKQILASDGNNYKISVTYGTEAEIPEGAELHVKEITEDDSTYDNYVVNTENALGWEEGSAGYIRLFDIKIVDRNGDKITIGSPVDVRIELADRESDAVVQVVHFADGSETGDVIENVEVDGEAVCIVANGFSAYAIVQGPAAGSVKGSIIETLSDLSDAVDDGELLYLSVKRTNNGEEYFTRELNSNSALKLTGPNNTSDAAKWIFESTETENVYRIRIKDGNYIKQEQKNSNNITLTPLSTDASVFELSALAGDKKRFYAKLNDNRFLQYSGSGVGIRLYPGNSNEGNSAIQIKLVNPPPIVYDPYSLEGMSYGLMNWSGEPTGKAVMASSETVGTMDANVLTVMSNANNTSQLFVPLDSDITMWTFEWVSDDLYYDLYYLKVVVGGEEKYLRIDGSGVSLVQTADEQCKIQVIPGSGSHSGQICLKCGEQTLTYKTTGEGETLTRGFTIGGEAGSEWLNFVMVSELTSEYFMTHTAQKVSVSDPTVTNGSKVIIYTRVWNDVTKKYEFYAVDSDGSLIPVYESGDHIQWVGGQFNSLLWDFVEYYWEGTTDPNYYYELYNEYSEKFIAPQGTSGQILSDSAVGINLTGRRNGYHYSSIVGWDDDNYAYTGLKADTTTTHSIVSCPLAETQDFYFAIVQDIPTGDELTTVNTVDNNLHGISMKMIDFASRSQMSDFLGNNDDATYSGNVAVLKQGLLSTNLINGYPTVTATVTSANPNGISLSNLYSDGLRDVNHLFIQSTYDESGYFEYDSTQNFASLQGENFKVYKELGTYDSGGNKSTLKHGQFFPFNDLKPGVFAAVNGKNLYSALADFRTNHQNTGLLPDGTPRKYEQLYSIEYGNKKANTFFGMELEASFTQTPNGHDDWGHDIIFEFTGDDDFWLYVDGELVIDLGGMHSAVPGSVNFATGTVSVHGVNTTLREVFAGNYRKRNPEATDGEVNAFLAEYFDEGETVFKEYTQHTMKIFYMERGAGASNLHMRFNLASVRKGHVLLSKKLDGVSDPDSFQAEFPYQIYYTLPPEDEGDSPEETLLTQEASHISVYYKDSIRPVKHKDTCVIDGVAYNSVFFLKPGEVADIAVPNSAINYRIVECGVNKSIYDSVIVKEDNELSETVNSANGRFDYSLSSKTTEARPRVTYVNHVDPDALKTLTFEKVLYAEDGVTRIRHEQDNTLFNFRLSLGTEFGELQAANMQTYCVKNNEGKYCKWDSTLQTPGFVSLGAGKSDFSQLTDDEKKAATFHASLNGSISKIPVDYTVEIREVLVGTQYKLEEKDSEIPDGYSRQKYILHENGADGSGEDINIAYVEDVVETNPHIEVCNLKGFGLRINKEWSDEEYMVDRAPAYFAVFTENENGDLTLVEDITNNIITVRQLPYSATPQTLYWYFDHLPVSGVPFEKYKVREVTIGNVDPTVDSDGFVTDYGTVTPVGDKEGVTIMGRQTGQDESTGYEYTVSYDDGEIETGSNVHVFSAENSRSGVKLYKMDGNTPLANAKFRLTKDGAQIGVFTSDENGLVTEAFLLPGQTYTYELMETNSPQGYQGIQHPIQLTLVGNTLIVVDENGVTHNYTPAEGDTMPTYIVQNRKYEFKVIKKNQSGQVLSGVTFALHKQKTVGGHTGIDVDPESGYESLTTNTDGIVPKLDDTLPPGTYELQETVPPSGYQALSGNVRFTISETGIISLDEGYYPEGEVELEADATTDPSKITYTMSIINRCPPMALKKEDNTGHPLPGAIFKLMSLNSGNVWVDMGVDGSIDMSSISEIVLPSFTNGRYRLQEEIAPEGYVIMTKYVYFTVENGSVRLTNETGGTPESANPQVVLDGDNVNGYTLTIKNTLGASLPATGGPGTKLFYLLGAMLTVLAGAGLVVRKRRKT
ncbi:LPXTG-motif cell wall anchor domain-containing protein/fibro-slime domain-containing protein [Sarcina sp. DSM 11001]|uniref:SpaA isopeptide-forming pilin-related protein n=1 Tax=Sarcina sp. DSM 11001 TaxID=1798184 RepID=UPI0008849E5D|nr:SpaA isopeptide-forming pilin-related protein [Sarcina sp. DSM 11001]SDM03028.1 LPXTG-motif cell wall anchor domain-containing protein/fibro-slime domain-containing protein [Sarcina sp. DSM 11001]